MNYFSYRDILNLEEYIFLLNQRYPNHIPEWQTLGLFSVVLFCWFL